LTEIKASRADTPERRHRLQRGAAVGADGWGRACRRHQHAARRDAAGATAGRLAHRPPALRPADHGWM